MEMKCESDNEFCVVNPTAPPTPNIVPVQKIFKSIPIPSGIARLPIAQEFSKIKIADGVVKLPAKLPTTRLFETKEVLLQRAKDLQELKKQKEFAPPPPVLVPRVSHTTIANAFGSEAPLNANLSITGNGSMSSLTTQTFRDFGQKYRWQYNDPNIVDMSTQDLLVNSITARTSKASWANANIEFGPSPYEVLGGTIASNLSLGFTGSASGFDLDPVSQLYFAYNPTGPIAGGFQQFKLDFSALTYLIAQINTPIIRFEFSLNGGSIDPSGSSSASSWIIAGQYPTYSFSAYIQLRPGDQIGIQVTNRSQPGNPIPQSMYLVNQSLSITQI